MADGTGDDVQVGVGFVADLDSLEGAFGQVMGLLRQFTARATSALDINPDLNTRRIRGEMERFADDASEAGRRTARALQGAEVQVNELSEAAAAARANMVRLGANDRTLAGFDTTVRDAVERLARLDERLEAGAISAQDYRRAQQQLAASIEITGREAQVANRQISALSNEQVSGRRNNSAQVQAAARVERTAAAERIAQLNAQVAAERNVAGAQRAAIQERIAATQSAARVTAAASAAEVQSGRTRVEVLRQVGRQLIIVERAAAAAARATVSGIGRLLSTTQAGLSRFVGLFRRSDSQINDGLQGALLQRERALSRSFGRQNAALNQAVAQQSATLARFERQASTGLAGIATGRSQLGALFGGGLAIGGGFVLARKLREGFQEAVNVNEAMNAMTLTFGSAADAISAFADTSVEALFMTRSEALKASTTMGVFGKSAGLVGPELAAFSTELVTLATDLASFYNTSPEDAVTAIGAALRGEQEPIRRYGVLLNEAGLQQTAFAEGIIDTIRKLTPQERVLAAQIAILEQTADAQGDAARTADQFANASRRARAASITTFAAIASAAVPLAEVFLRGLIPAMEFLGRFIEGNVSPALDLLRTGLIGAGAAMAGLLAARVAGEGLQFLALGLRAALTPMGLLITSIALAGAAFAILRTRVPAVNELLGQLREEVGSLAGRGFEIVADGIRTAAAALIEILPLLIRVGVVIGGEVADGARALADLFGDRVQPVLERVAGIITGTVIPALFGLGNAIGNAFQGDFGALGDIANSAVNAFRDLGGRVLSVIQAGMAPVVDYLSGLFGRINFGQLAVDVLTVVNEAGRLLGSFITSPGFVTAVAGIAAAAAALAGSFLIGFVEGVVRGLPGAVDQIFNLLGGALQQAGLPGIVASVFSNAFSGIPAIIAAVLLGRNLFQGLTSSFRTAGEQGAASYGAGLARGARDWAGVARNGAAGIDAALDRGMRRTFTNMANEVNTFERRMSTLGQTFTRFGSNVEGGLANARTEWARLNEQVGQSAIQAALFRNNVRAMVTGFDQGTQQMIGRWQAFRNLIADQGGFAAAGRKAGIGLVGAMGAAMAGSQGFSGAAFMGIVASGLASAFATGSPAVGAVVAGVGLITAAWNEGKRAAEKFQAAVEELTTAILNNASSTAAFNDTALLPLLESMPGLVRVMNEAGVSIPELSTALRGSEEQFAAMLETLLEVNAGMDGQGIAALSLATQLDGLAKQYQASTAAADELIAAGYETASSTGSQLSVLDRASQLWAAYRGQLDEWNAAAGRTGLAQLRIRDTTTSLFTDISSLVQRAGGSITDVFDFVVEEAERLDLEIDLTWLAELVGGTEEASQRTGRSLAEINAQFDGVAASIDRSGEAAAAAFAEFEESIQESFAKSADHVFNFSVDAESSLDDWQASLIGNAQEVDTWQKNLSAIYAALTAEGRTNSEAIVKFLADQGPAMSGLVQDLVDDLGQGGTEWTETMDAITLATAVAERDVTGSFAGMGLGAAAGAAGIKSELASGIAGQAKLAAGLAAPIGRNIMTGVATGIRNNVTTALTEIRLATSKIIAEGQNSIQAQSPSKLTNELIGLPMIQGIAAGIIAGTPQAKIDAALAAGEITEEMADQLREDERFAEEARNMTERVAEAIVDEWESHRDAIVEAFEATIDELEGVLETAEGKLSAAWERITDRFTRMDFSESLSDAQRELEEVRRQIAENQNLINNRSSLLQGGTAAVQAAKAQLKEAERLVANLDKREDAAEERVRRAEAALQDPTLTFLGRNAAQQELVAAQGALDQIQSERAARDQAVSEATRRVEEAMQEYQDLVARIAEAQGEMPELQEQLSDQLRAIQREWFDILQFMVENDMDTFNGQSLAEVRQLAGVTQDEFLRLVDAIREIDRAEGNLGAVSLNLTFPDTFTIEIEGQPITVSLTAETLALLQQLDVTIGN